MLQQESSTSTCTCSPRGSIPPSLGVFATHRVGGADLLDRDVDDGFGEHDHVGVLVDTELRLCRVHCGGPQEELPVDGRSAGRNGGGGVKRRGTIGTYGVGLGAMSMFVPITAYACTHLQDF